MLREMMEKLEAKSGHIEMSFPYFVNKAAPVSRVQSLMDYDVTFIGEIDQRQTALHHEGAGAGDQPVPVLEEDFRATARTTSARMSRSRRAPTASSGSRISSTWLEKQASCELYGLLKRPDEKFVTERAYDNPKFVEDMVRDVAAVLNADERIECVRGRVGELRVDPQPLGLCADRKRQDERPSA